MPWRANPNIGAKAYYAHECYVCGATPWYRVGVKAFCKRHKSHAAAIRRSVSAGYDLGSAVRESALKVADVQRQSSDRNRKANGTK